MARIAELLEDGLPKVVADFNTKIGEPSHVISKRLDEGDLGDLSVLRFPARHDLDSKTMIAVDGGNTMQQLAGGDLIVAGATIGQAAQGLAQFSEDDTPAEAYAAVLPHMAENAQFQGAIRSLMELRLLYSTPADIKIIDGAYLQHITSVLFTLVGDQRYTRYMLDFIRDDEEECLRKAMDELLGVSDPTLSHNIVAVTKSDSSREYTKRFFGSDEAAERFPGISDRILASRLLNGGEFLSPRPLIATRQIINKLNAMNVGERAKKLKKDGALFRSLVENRAEQLDELDSRDPARSKLWTTYFKPYMWSRFEPAMKIEFTHSPDSAQSVAERAAELIGWIDQDIVGQEFLEPWCQYEADRLAKDVSLGTDILRSHLIDQIEDEQLTFGLLRSYRS